MSGIVERYGSLQSQIAESILEELESSIVSIMSVGGVSRGEVKEGWSDIDLLVVIRDSADRESVERSIEEIGGRVTGPGFLRLRPGQGIFSPWVFAEAEVHSGRAVGQGFEYFNFVRDALPLYGDDVRGWLSTPDHETIVRTAKQALRQAALRYNPVFAPWA